MFFKHTLFNETNHVNGVRKGAIVVMIRSKQQGSVQYS